MDIVIITSPLERNYPLSAPAQLKSVIIKNGFTCKTIDWNNDLHCKLKNQLDSFTKFGSYVNDENFNTIWKNKIKNIAIKWIDDLKKINPKWIALSIFTHQTFLLEKLLKLIRKKLNSKVIIGGHGIHYNTFGCATNLKELLGPKLKKENLVDYFVTGEGEISIINILKKNNNIEGINNLNYNRIKDLSNLPLPDYTDYDFSKYDKNFLIPITFSRGCFFNCSYCYKILPTFYCKDGEIPAHEMFSLNKKYNIKKFCFSDSTLPALKNKFISFLDNLINYNINIQWTGCYNIIKKNNKLEEVIKKIKLSGGNDITIGVESGSEIVRNHMNKSFFTNDDIIYNIDLYHKYNVSLLLIFMVGYINETKEEFEKTKKLLNDLKKYKKCIKLILGYTCYILPNTKLSEFAKEKNIKYDSNGNWIYKNNTFDVRVKRWLELKSYAEELGYNVYDKKRESFLTSQLKGKYKR